MIRTLFALTLFGSIGLGAVHAQNPGYPMGNPGFQQGYPPQGFMPNIYNRGTQPLSPYLNLLRGTGNPAIDYYYGVRGMSNGGQGYNQQFGGNAGGGNQMLNSSQMRTGYIPQAGNATPEPQPLPDAGKEVILPPSGHPVMYGNFNGMSQTGVPGTGGRSGFFAPPTTGTVKPTPKK